MTDPPASPDVDHHLCQACGTAQAPGARFCMECGTPTAVVIEQDRAAEVAADGPALLVECEVCGAGNAASRPLCARCGTPMREEVPGGDALPEPRPPAAEASGVRRDSSPLLLSLVVLAGLLIAGVLLALVTSRVRTPAVPVVPAGVLPAAISASSEHDGHEAGLVSDGDPATSWVPRAQDSAPELVLRLDRSLEIEQILVWNGDQASPDAFAASGRASALRIGIGDRLFRVALLDVDGPQAIDLPGLVGAEEVRITIEGVTPGSATASAALSEVVVQEAER